MTRFRFDRSAKLVLDRCLSPMGQVLIQEEVLAQVQAIDVWFVPDAVVPASGDRIRQRRVGLGLLGRMTVGPCVIEPFHRAPSTKEVRGCQTKQFIVQCRFDRKAQRTRSAETVPWLWLLAAGKPWSALARLHFAPDPDWPPGFYKISDAHATHIVVLRELPETPDTLILRLLGAGATYAQAVAELKALPPHHWLAREVLPALALRQRSRNNRSNRTMCPENQELQDIFDSIIAEERTDALNEGMKQGLDEGMKKGLDEGLVEGLRRALVQLYTDHYGAPPDEITAALDAQADPSLLQDWISAFTRLDQDDVRALVLSHGRDPA